MIAQSVIIAIAISFVVGAGSGYSYRDTKYKADMANVIREAYEAAKKEAKQSVKIEKVYIKGDEKIQTIYKTIIKEIPKYVPVIQKSDSDCNVSNGAVSLLNSTINNALPETTANTDDTNKTASRIRESDLINFTHLSIKKYNEALTQCNALIGWIESTNK